MKRLKIDGNPIVKDKQFSLKELPVTCKSDLYKYSLEVKGFS